MGAWVLIVAFFVPPYFAAVIYLATKEYQPMSLFLKDLLERAAKTFVQVFVAAVPVGSIFDWGISGAKGAVLAAAGAALSVITSAISKRFGSSPDNASVAV